MTIKRTGVIFLLSLGQEENNTGAFKMKKNTPDTPLLEALLNTRKPVITDHDLYWLIAQEHKATPDTHTKLSTKEYKKILATLLREKHLANDRDINRLYRIRDNNDAAASDICAIADPFCYISHLSAMQRYGFTDRFPAALILTTPSPATWKAQAKASMDVRYGNAVKGDGFIPLAPLRLPSKVRGQEVQRHTTSNPARIIQIRDAFARISTIGATFHDMLDKPALCGGMTHVLEVWQEHSSRYLEEIIAAINTSPHKIVQVRAGYILEELLAINDPRIALWRHAAMRGGSRRLDPEKPFKAVFSKKWMLSLNVTPT